MKNIHKILTLIVGSGTIVFMYQLLAGFAFFGGGFNLKTSLIILLGSISLQLGFICSAFVLNKNIFIKVGVLVSMIPFFCLFILHDQNAIYKYMLPLNSAVLDWRYNFNSNLMSVLVCLLWLIAYSFNAARLLFSIPKSFFETIKLK